MALPFASLRDNFSDNATADCWLSYTAGSATVAETGGQVQITLPSSTAGTHEAGYRSVSRYALTSDSFYITIGTMVATGVAAFAYYDLRLNPDNANALRWIQQSNTLKAQSIVGGVTTDRYSVTWSGTTYKYLRTRADTTTVYWDSSSNGTTWTNRASLAISSLFDVSALYAAFGAGCGNVASPGSFHLDDVNLILPALTTNWRWTQARWPLTNRHRTITLALDTAGTAQAYIVSADDVDVSDNPSGSIRYWSGPADGGRELTEQASQSAAQDMAVDIPLDGRFDLPEQIDARVFRVYHRSIDGNAYTIRELYPRRLIQADDVDAEIIRGLVISGHRFICDELSALSANVGVLTAGVIDGVTIYAGGSGHPVTLDSTGIFITLPDDAVSALASIRFLSSTGGEVAILNGYNGATGSFVNTLTLEAKNSGTNKGSDLGLASQRDGTGTAHVGITCTNTSGPPSVRIDVYDNHSTNGDYIDINAPLIWIEGDTIIQNSSLNVEVGLNVGSAAGATDGQILATVADAGTTNVPTITIFGHNSSGTPAAGFGSASKWRLNDSTTDDIDAFQINVSWATATHNSQKARAQLYAFDVSARECIRLEASGSASMLSFHGSAAQAKPTVTGSRASNAALASLLTALANYGLIVDSSS